MPWRAHYETRILRDLVCPVCQLASLTAEPVPQDNQIWVGGFGFSALTQQGTWWRLFQSDFARDSRVIRVFVLPKVGQSEVELAMAMVPPSEHDRTFLVADPNGWWAKLLEPEDQECGFAAIIHGATVPLAMVGSPTEDAWDLFSAAVKGS